MFRLTSMTRTLSLLLALSLAVAAPTAFAKTKLKHKDKRFDLVTLESAARAEGNYQGIEGSHVLELRTAPGGFVGTLRYRGQTAPLTQLSVGTQTMVATLNWPDGRKETIRGRFVNRVRDGRTTFGLLASGLNLRIEGAPSIQTIFFERVSP